jgi:hypothetical protein
MNFDYPHLDWRPSGLPAIWTAGHLGVASCLAVGSERLGGLQIDLAWRCRAARQTARQYSAGVYGATHAMAATSGVGADR